MINITILALALKGRYMNSRGRNPWKYVGATHE